MKNIGIFSFFCFFCLQLFSQTKILTSDYVYIINNQKLGEIINDFIEHEKQYDYFDTTSILQMQITRIDSSQTIFLMSGFNPREISDWTFWNEINDKYFIVKYKQYYFRLYSRAGENFLDTNLFIKSNESFHIKVNLKGKEPHRNESRIRLIIEDDTFMETTWVYVYQNRRFYEISRFARNYGRIK